MRSDRRCSLISASAVAFMVDDVRLNKSAIIERCLRRIDEEYSGRKDELVTNQTRQDAILLNLQRACEAAIDLAMHEVRKRRLGVPQDSRDAFELILKAQIIDADLAKRMKAMVGFRNIAIRQYQDIDLNVVRAILETRLNDFRAFVSVLLRSDAV